MPNREQRKDRRKERREARLARQREQWKEHRAAAIVYFLLRLVVIEALVAAVLHREWESVFICALTLILFTLPAFIEKNFRVDLPDTLEIIILFFIFATQILGELDAWYVRYQGWDTLMHTTNGFLCAAIGFCLVDLLNRNETAGLKLSPLYLSLVAFCFSMTVGVLWEFFEFAMDRFFLQDMQKDTVIHTISSVALDPSMSNRPVVIQGITDAAVNGQSLGLGGYLDIGLIDTMKDLFVNFIGAVVFSVIGYFYVKGRGKTSFAGRFIPVVLSASPSGEPSEEPPPPEESQTQEVP